MVDLPGIFYHWLSGMADHIFVEINGVKIPVSEMADVSFYDRRLNPHILTIAPHDPNVLNAFIFNLLSLDQIVCLNDFTVILSNSSTVFII